MQDLRTVGSKGVRRPSPDLLEVVHLCQRRQDWYREYAEQHGEEPRSFVGSATLSRSVTDVAAEMRRALEFGTDARRTSVDSMRLFVDRTEATGVLVMVSGVVKNCTNRPLDPDEFRGFALVDPLAPLVFVNGADSKPAQMFTLAHELAHLWLGQSALSDASLNVSVSSRIETWCNQVAAEFLVPLDEIQALASDDPLTDLDLHRKAFKASTLVVLRRLWDAGMIDAVQFRAAYAQASQGAASKPRSSGGDFYNTLPIRASRRFVRALIASTLEGKTLYREALQLLSISSVKTLNGIGEKVGGMS